jgi:WD40 repeat protein
VARSRSISKILVVLLVAAACLTCWFLLVSEPSAPDLVVALDGATTCVVVSPDCATVAIGLSSGQVALLSSKDMTIRKKRSVQRSTVSAIGFAPGGVQIVVGSKDGTVLVLDANTCAELYRCSEIRNPIADVAFAESDDQVLVCGDRRAYLWRPRDNSALKALPCLHDVYSSSCTASSVVLLGPAVLSVAPLSEPERLAKVVFPMPTPQVVAVSAGTGAMLGFGSDTRPWFWSGVQGDEPRYLEFASEYYPSAMAISDDGCMAALGRAEGQANAVVLWDVAKWCQASRLAAPACVQQLVFSPDRSFVVGTTDGPRSKVLLWRLRAAK